MKTTLRNRQSRVGQRSSRSSMSPRYRPHNPLLHLITVSLVFGFGAGIVSRTSVRPGMCVAALLTATVPTVVALAMHAAEPNAMSLHQEMFLIEAFIVAAIMGLSLQTVAHLYRSAV